MANQETTYLKLPFNESGDTGFRTQYNLAQDKLDAIVPSAASMIFPEKRESTFDDGIFAADGVNFDLVPKGSRYCRIGNIFFYEVQVKAKKALAVPAGSGNITNIVMGTFSSAFQRFGSAGPVTSMNQTAFAGAYSGTNSISLAAYGGQSVGITIPIGTPFCVSGFYYLSA